MSNVRVEGHSSRDGHGRKVLLGRSVCGPRRGERPCAPRQSRGVSHDTHTCPPPSRLPSSGDKRQLFTAEPPVFRGHREIYGTKELFVWVCKKRSASCVCPAQRKLVVHAHTLYESFFLFRPTTVQNYGYTFRLYTYIYWPSLHVFSY